MSDRPDASVSHPFYAPAMNTTFVFRIDGPDPDRAQAWAGSAMRLLEELEAELSRYRPDSDVSRINQLQAGQSMLLGDAANRCLRAALEACEQTAGLFDPTVGSHTTKPDQRPDHPLRGRLILDPDKPRITCEEEGRRIDLGGIGKGFALDEMAALLLDLGAESFLLSAGASTHLRHGSRDWTFTLRGGREKREIVLRDRQALSSSGLAEQGGHVIHPDTGTAPAYSFRRVWVVCPCAARADAFSTACLLMDEEEIQSFGQAVDEVTALYALPGNRDVLTVIKGDPLH